MNLKQIPKAALMPEAVYQQLKTAILRGVFRPGQTLRQEDVAARADQRLAERTGHQAEP